ncbi:DUF4265 domain-containing protein [Streptomyces sp. NPDC001070]
MESLWAIDRGDGRAELANSPFFVRGVAIGDIVETSADDDGVRWAVRVVRPSNNCTIRLIVFRDKASAAARQSVVNAFLELGAGGEGIERFGMVSLDNPLDLAGGARPPSRRAPEPAKTCWRTTATTATFPEAVRENEEVVSVNTVSTWVLPSGVTVGR